MRDPLGKKNLRDDGERAKEDLQTNAKDMGKYYPNCELEFRQGARASITFTRAARVGEDYAEDVYEVAQEWTREDIDAILEERVVGFKSARERVLLSAVAGKIEL